MATESPSPLSRLGASPKLLPRLLAPETADAVVRAIWSDIREQRTVFQTHQQDLLKKNGLEVHGRNCATMLGLHWGLTPLIAAEAGCDLLPSFVFFRIYYKDDVCRVHSDRPACELSLSLALAYSDGEPWELSVGKSADFDSMAVTDDFGDEPHESYRMEAGDGLLYSGSLRRHGRTRPNPNRWSAHLFLQWVDPAGPHASEAFERLDLGKRPAL